MAAGPHPFPFRTRQLSPPAPMVLGGRSPWESRTSPDFFERARPEPTAHASARLSSAGLVPLGTGAGGDIESGSSPVRVVVAPGDRWFDVGEQKYERSHQMHRYRKVAALCITVTSLRNSLFDRGHLGAGKRIHEGDGDHRLLGRGAGGGAELHLPLHGPGYFTTANVQQFQDLMYRPLYWMGKGSTPDLNPTLSLAKPPVYGPGNTVIITLKPYKWSDGESLDAQDVMFWMNMLHAEKVNWAAYTPGSHSRQRDQCRG